VPTITKAAERAGRPAPRIAAGVPVCVTNNVDGALERAGRNYGYYDNLPSYRAMLDREGVSGPVDLAVVGDEDRVSSKLAELGDLGVTDLSLPVFGSAEERQRTLDLLTSLAAKGA
jgi:alkanesulfonate monooxygenase SsuD/methylene tetrahydromethanopterin reductase-like flavin-dependent oxidoreductase (luciferase family)